MDSFGWGVFNTMRGQDTGLDNSFSHQHSPILLLLPRLSPILSPAFSFVFPFFIYFLKCFSGSMHVFLLCDIISSY
jgi:hypothetical protein